MFVVAFIVRFLTIVNHSLLLLGATLIILSSQFTFLLNFFLSRNIRIAREHAWGQTIASRGKGPSFWQPYVEEWALPPTVEINQRMGVMGLEKAKSKLVRFAIKKCGLHVVSRFLQKLTLHNSNTDPTAYCSSWW